MARKESIKDIIKARNKKGDLFQKFIGWLTNVNNGLQVCKKQFENPEIARQIEAVKLSSFLGAIDNIISKVYAQKKLLEKVRIRLGRNTITIAVAGEARIGKSTFLQSFTGLNNNQIPTQVTGACTSTQSIISHIDSDDGYAIVHYYEKDAFLNIVIKNRYEKLKWDTACLATISNFKEDFPNHKRPVDAIEIEIYDDLKLYYDNIDDICKNIFDQFKMQERLDDLNNVKEFVTYSKESGLTQSRASNLVVKKVEIFCKFPMDDVGQISVIDTPGMNTTTEERDREILCDVLNNSADFVLLFGAPGTLGLSAVETRLCSDFRQCMPLLAGDELNKRAFFLANQGKFVDDKGALYRDSTNEEFNKLHYNAYEKGLIPVAKYIRLNAKDPQQVQENVLDPLLNYLSENFPEFDDAQEKAAKEILVGIGKDVETLLADIDKELGFIQVADTNGFSKLFLNEFEQLLSRLSSHLSRTLEGMMPSREIDIEAYMDGVDNTSQGNVFTKTLNQIFTDYNEKMPDFLTINAIQNEMFNNPGLGGAAFFNLMGHLRCYIISLFAAMDANCQQIVEDAKIKLENVFRDPAAGRMGGVKELENMHGSEFFEALARFAKTVKAPILTEQLETYAKFNLSFSGFMAHKVSKNLDSVRNCGYMKVVEQIDFSSAEAIQEVLAELGRRAMNDVAVELSQSLSSEPNEAVFAMSENFVDITLRTKSVKDDWSELYFVLKGDVWPEHFNPNHSTNHSMLQMRENLLGLKSLVNLLKKLVV